MKFSRSAWMLRIFRFAASTWDDAELADEVVEEADLVAVDSEMRRLHRESWRCAGNCILALAFEVDPIYSNPIERDGQLNALLEMLEKLKRIQDLRNWQKQKKLLYWPARQRLGCGKPRWESLD